MNGMSHVQLKMAEFLRELERSSNHKLSFPHEVGELLDSARAHHMMEAFEEAIFLAKFVTRSASVMKRIGPGGDGFDKLSSEVEASIGNAVTLLKSISATCPDDVSTAHTTAFFSTNHEALNRLMGLFSDLTLVKNWTLDKKPLP
jgi:hypothetical protein